MMLMNHRSCDKDIAMRRTSCVSNIEIDRILSKTIPDVLLVFTRLCLNESKYLEKCHPSIIRNAFELAILIKADAEWFTEASATIEDLLATTHKDHIDETTALDECSEWNRVFSLMQSTQSKESAYVSRAYHHSQTYRAAILDLAMLKRGGPAV